MGVQAKPKKLRNGDWGAWAESEAVEEGDTLHITAKSGKSWDAVVDRVLWAGSGGAICALRKKGGHRSRTTCRDCHGPLVDAPHHRSMGGLCGQCAFDEYDM